MTTTTRPQAPMIVPSGIPAELRERPQWVNWRYKLDRSERWTKLPINPRGKAQASVTEPRSWSSFAEALTRAGDDATIDGIGFVFSPGDPYAGVDLDDCYDGTTLAPWAQTIVSMLDSYTEISPSGAGVKIIVRASHPGQHYRRGSIEMYDSTRFFTITGRRLAGTPATIEDRHGAYLAVHRQVFGDEQPAPARPAIVPSAGSSTDAEVIARLQRHPLAGRLWAGDTSATRETKDGTPSGADLALCNHLRYETGGDPEQVDRLFRQSGLYRAERWDQPARSGETYGAGTIRMAFTSGATRAGASNGHQPEPVSPIVDTPPADPCAGLRDENQQLRAALAAETARADQAEHLYRLLTQSLLNPENTPSEVVTALMLGGELLAAKAAGHVDADGLVVVTQGRVSKIAHHRGPDGQVLDDEPPLARATQSKGTIGRNAEALCTSGVFHRIEEQGRSPARGLPITIHRYAPPASMAAIFERLATGTITRIDRKTGQEKQRQGGYHAPPPDPRPFICEQHPDAPVVVSCQECDLVLGFVDPPSEEAHTHEVHLDPREDSPPTVVVVPTGTQDDPRGNDDVVQHEPRARLARLDRLRGVKQRREPILVHHEPDDVSQQVLKEPDWLIAACSAGGDD